MALIIETGAVVPGANSYVSVAEADSYLAYSAQRVAWAALATPDKEAALVQAARALNTAVIWKGTPVELTQALAWPRNGVYVGSELLPSDTIPGQVKTSQMELAALMMQGDRTADPDSAGIASMSLGKGALAVTFDKSTAPTILGPVIPSLLRDLSEGTIGGGFRTASTYRK